MGGPLHHEDQSCCAARAEVLGLDWWFHPLVFEYLPADVGVQDRVRRIRPNNRAQEVLLRLQWQVQFTAFSVGRVRWWMVGPQDSWRHAGRPATCFIFSRRERALHKEAKEL